MAVWRKYGSWGWLAWHHMSSFAECSLSLSLWEMKTKRNSQASPKCSQIGLPDLRVCRSRIDFMGSMIDYNYLDTVNNSNISQPLLQRCNHANISIFLFLGYEIPNRLICNMRHDNFFLLCYLIFYTTFINF